MATVVDPAQQKQTEKYIKSLEVFEADESDIIAQIAKNWQPRVQTDEEIEAGIQWEREAREGLAEERNKGLHRSS